MRAKAIRRLGTAGILLTTIPLWTAQAQPAPARAGEPVAALTLFGARMTDNSFDEVLTARGMEWRDTYLLGIAGSRRIGRLLDHFDIEAELQTARHFGGNHHWEFNAAVIGRWSGFPWRRHLHTSIAWGIGPSYATRTPPEEVERSGTSGRLRVYWVAELEAGPPAAPWSVLTRLHHRSTGFGLLGEEGGSNWVTVGVRWRF
ncbi:MAG TPA: hypothetical protein VEY95_04350 [Azospirillaceae bacterium]|nr:hypothetical protein [Azospirillaceae bacterium]